MPSQSLPDGSMATAIKVLARSLSGLAIAHPEWTTGFEEQKERLGLAVIAVVASVQGHSDDWVHRSYLPKIEEQVRQQVREEALSKAAIENAQEAFNADCGGPGRHMGSSIHPPHPDRIANAINTALAALHNKGDTDAH